LVISPSPKRRGKNFRDGADEDIEYEYDANGNMTKDLNRQICNIDYNY
jgi:hypothetical protein